jgi:hypothetical protein
MKKDQALQDILKDKYKEPEEDFYNVFINYINYWHDFNHNGNKEIDKTWYKLSNHISKDYPGADTIFSLWIPMSWVMLSINPEKAWYKQLFVEEATKSSNMKSFLETYLPEDNELVKKLHEFAIVASSEENVFSVPKEKLQLNNEEYSLNRYRGFCYYDEMPVMLYCLLEGANGKSNNFSKYFESTIQEETKENILKFIKSNKLEVFFNNEDIGEDINNCFNLKDLGVSNTKKEKITKESDLIKLLDNYIKVLEERRKLFDKESKEL